MIQNDISSAGQDKGNRPRKRLVRTGALKSRRYYGRHESGSGSTLADDSDYKGKYEALPPPDTSSAGEPVYRPYLNEPAGDKLPYEAKYEAEPAMPVYQGKYSSSDEDNDISGEGIHQVYKGKYGIDDPDVDGYTSRVVNIRKSPDTKKKRSFFRRSRTEDERVNAAKELNTPEQYKELKKNDRRREPKKSGRQADLPLKIGAVAFTVLLSAAMVFTMPIMFDNSVDEQMSLVKFIKNRQPLVYAGIPERENPDVALSAGVVKPEDPGISSLQGSVQGQYTVLFLGFDREEEMTDVIWVFQFDTENGKLNILQIPENTYLPDHTAYPSGTFGSIYKNGKPDVNPPAKRVAEAIEQNFGIPIDSYVTSYYGDIDNLTKLLGGLPFTFEEELSFGKGKVIRSGETTITDKQAEWFLHLNPDEDGDLYGRTAAQRIFMAAFMNRLSQLGDDTEDVIKEICDKEYILTNMSLKDINILVKYASTVPAENMRVDMIAGEPGKFTDDDGVSYDVYAVHRDACLTMINKYYRPHQEALNAEDSVIKEYSRERHTTVYDETGILLSEVKSSIAAEESTPVNETADSSADVKDTIPTEPPTEEYTYEYDYNYDYGEGYQEDYNDYSNDYSYDYDYGYDYSQDYEY